MAADRPPAGGARGAARGRRPGGRTAEPGRFGRPREPARDLHRRLQRPGRRRASTASKWNYETGDNVNNHEREWYTSGTANAALDGNGHLVITAKKENAATHCWYGAVRVHLGPADHLRQVHRAVRPRRGAHEDPARPGHVARVLDARQQHRQRRLAQLRRDRHHGERRLRAEHRARHHPRPRLLRLRRHRRRLQRAGLRRRLPHLRGRLVAEQDHLVGRRQRLRDPHAGRRQRQPVGVQPPLLHHSQPRRRRLLARRPGRQHPSRSSSSSTTCT